MVLIKFIVNFILFGALFYLIWHFFPETFTTLVIWIKAIIEFTQQFVTDLINKISTSTSKHDIEQSKSVSAVIFAFLK